MPDNKGGGIKRSRILAQPLYGRAGLLRETGASQDHGVVFDAWARGLGNQELWSYANWPNSRYTGTVSFFNLLHDEASQSVIAGAKGYHNGRCVSSIVALEKRSPDTVYKPHHDDDVLGPQSMVECLSVSPSRVLLAALGQSSLCMISVDDITKGRPVWPFPYNPVIRINPGVRCWASAANPRQDICSFAVAASDGTYLVSENEGRYTLQHNVRYQGMAEAVAVDWLGPNVILKGDRDGGVRLFDIRSGAENWEPRIQHTIAVSHVRSIDENLIVVASVQNELCTYDLRFAKRPSLIHATQEFDRFPTFHNLLLSHHTVGLDVHGTLVAVISDNKRVQIFDVKKGVELGSRIRNLGSNATCVRFMDEKRSANGLKLLVAAGPAIDEWAFEGPGEMDL